LKKKKGAEKKRNRDFAVSSGLLQKKKVGGGGLDSWGLSNQKKKNLGKKAVHVEIRKPKRKE